MIVFSFIRLYLGNSSKISEKMIIKSVKRKVCAITPDYGQFLVFKCVETIQINNCQSIYKLIGALETLN